MFVSTIETQAPVLQLPPAAPAPPAIGDWLLALRPRQWAKNMIVFAGMIFAGKVIHPSTVWTITGGFAVFCAFSSVGYLINDVLDREKDRAHPVKCRRPIASGRIRPGAAIVFAIMLALAGFAASWALSHTFIWVSLAYLVVSLSYSLYWKHLVILDMMAIPACFLLRALAGTTLLKVWLSPWLFVCLSLLALLVAIGKRRHELTLLECGQAHRPVLADYSRLFLDQALTMAASAALVSYSVYCISSPTAMTHRALVFTVPLVIFSLLRYMYLVFHCEQGGQPEDIFLADRPMQISIMLWVALMIAIFLLKGSVH